MNADRVQAPLVLIGAGYNIWHIYEPGYNFGKAASVGHSSSESEDRRYERVATVDGSLFDALKVLHRLEKGRS